MKTIYKALARFRKKLISLNIGVFMTIILMVFMASPVQATMYYYMAGTTLICYESDVKYTEVWDVDGKLYGLDADGYVWWLGTTASMKNGRQNKIKKNYEE